jgi:hypothetical protein
VTNNAAPEDFIRSMNSVHASGVDSSVVIQIEVLAFEISNWLSSPASSRRTIKLPSLRNPGQWWSRSADNSDAAVRSVRAPNWRYRHRVHPLEIARTPFGEFLPRPERTILLCVEFNPP